MTGDVVELDPGRECPSIQNKEFKRFEVFGSPFSVRC